MFKRLWKQNLFFAFLIITIFQFFNSGLYFYVPLYLESIGLSGYQIGWLFALSAITGLLFIFNMGLMADRVPIKALLMTGLLLMGVYMFGFSNTVLFPVLIILFFIGGFGNNLYLLSMDNLVLKKAGFEKGRLFGSYSATKVIPAALGMLVAGYLLTNIEFSLALKLLGFVMVTLTIMSFLVPSTQKKISPVKSYFKDFFNMKVLPFVILIFIFTIHWGVEGVAYGLFLRTNLNLSFIQMGWYMSIPIIILGFASIYMGKRYDQKPSIRTLLLAGFLMAGAGLALMAITTNPILSAFFRVIHEVGDAAFTLFMFIGAESLFAKERMGGNFGLLTLITVIGRFVGSLVFSPIGSTYGYQWPHIIAGSFIFLAGFFFLVFEKGYFKQPTEQ